MAKSEWKWLTLETIEKPSSYFGNCEVCNQPVKRVKLLRGKLAKSPFTILHTFGHKDCLEQRIHESINHL